MNVAFDMLDPRVKELTTNKRKMVDLEASLLQSYVEENDLLKNGIGQLKDQLLKEQQAKDQAYSERNRLVSFMSKIFPACIIKHEAKEGEESWDPEWLNIVCIDTPKGQMTWHVHQAEIATMFSHLEVDEDVKWDGHTTEEKYGRVAKLTLNDIC